MTKTAWTLALALTLCLAPACRDEQPVESVPPQTPEGQGRTAGSEGGTDTSEGRDAASQLAQAPPSPSVAPTPATGTTPSPRPTPSQFFNPRVLAIDHYLTRPEVRELTGFIGALTETDLQGQEPSNNYNAMRFGGEDHLGVALQVWDLASAAATTRQFQRMRDTYVDARGTRAVGDGAFRSNYPGIRQLVFMSRSRNTIVALACDDTVCGDDDALVELAQRVEGRL